MTWTPCPFWPGCGAGVEGGCADCAAEFDDEAWFDDALEDGRDDPAEARERRMVALAVPLGKVMARLVECSRTC